MLWWLLDDARLIHRVRRVIEGPDLILWSVISTWEIALKYAAGRLELKTSIETVCQEIENQGVELLGVDHRHCIEVAHLPLHHRDPFDRMLVAQARVESVPLLTRDAKIRAYDVEVVW